MLYVIIMEVSLHRENNIIKETIIVVDKILNIA